MTSSVISISLYVSSIALDPVHGIGNLYESFGPAQTDIYIIILVALLGFKNLHLLGPGLGSWDLNTVESSTFFSSSSNITE